jgi:hypothetical protein
MIPQNPSPEELIMSGDPQHDLEWHAFLYVSGEMSRVEAEAFEGRLAEDQQAREAVAQAVELLTKLTAEANSVREIASASGWPFRGPTIFAAMATAAALVLVCFSLARRPQFGFDTEPAGALVSMWADSDESVDQGEADGFEEADDLAVPGWMLAAVESRPNDKLENKLEEN